MRLRFTLPRWVTGGLAACVTVGGLLAAPAAAAPHASSAPPSTVRPTAAASLATPRPTAQSPTLTGADERPAVRRRPVGAARLAPQRTQTPDTVGEHPRTPARKAAACDAAAFAGRTGTDLVAYVRAAPIGCVNTLFDVTGRTAHDIFREGQMVSVADAFAASAASYHGDDSTGIWQLVLFLRAGYYVQSYHQSDVGAYGPRLAAATRSGLDAFFGNSRSGDVSSANGDVLGEVVVLTDSAGEQGRYLDAYERILIDYDSSYDAVPSMVAAVNDVYTPLWRGNWNPEYVSAVTDDPSIIYTLHFFAFAHLGLLGTGNSVLDSNAGMIEARYLEHPALRGQVRPLVEQLLHFSRVTGPTARLWVAVATQAATYDKDHCSAYGVCHLPARLAAAALPRTHSCDAHHTIRAQALSAREMEAACASVLGQDAYFRRLVGSGGPIPGQYESSIEFAVFASRADYQTYAGAIFGIDTDNGGMTLIGDPADPGNKPLSVMYQKDHDDGFPARIWNLNHEYTHYLDARYDMKGDFGKQTSVPDVWWIEGVAEYVSYGYRGITDDEAVAEAAKHTYKLSTLFGNTYANSDVTRTYPWGYLAVRYMMERHPADVAAMLARFRVGDYQGGHAVYATRIGTRYDADFDAWLSARGSGAQGVDRPALHRR
ncbi:collagenase [Streptomyces beihaiensis]|uniref:microbial collagenase n=1 Tax=Streptomyces beihaiensis TaxID=2984495 RepID=A0ABT3TY19_9ACTN|nr:collagenase [Streptomyces beihaiensis]MCX3061944.1 collagenase [Streptomyces beihaiensis]